tara:strand:- start:10822 stop:12771 length:1950 start_codon:yes stop_codon:yes gene_type:complete
MGIFEPRWLVELCERAPTCTRVTQALEEFDTRQRIQRGAFRETNAKKVGHVLRILAQQKELSVKLVAAINENRLVDSLLVRGSLIELEKAASRASSSGTVDDLMENSINFVRSATSDFCHAALQSKEVLKVINLSNILVRVQLQGVVESVVKASIKELFSTKFTAEFNVHGSTISHGDEIRLNTLPLHVLYNFINMFLTQIIQEKDVREKSGTQHVLATLFSTWLDLLELFLLDFAGHIEKRYLPDRSNVSKESLKHLDGAIEDIILLNRICRAQHTIFVESLSRIRIQQIQDSIMFSRETHDTLLPTLSKLVKYCLQLEEKHMHSSVYAFGRPIQITALDDIFFIMSRSIRRTLAFADPSRTAKLLKITHTTLAELFELSIKVHFELDPITVNKLFALSENSMAEIHMSEIAYTEPLARLVNPINAASMAADRTLHLLKDVDTLCGELFSDSIKISEIIASTEALNNIADQFTNWYESCVSSIIRERMKVIAEVCEQAANEIYVLSEDDYATIDLTSTWAHSLLVYLLDDFRTVSNVFTKQVTERYIHLKVESLSTRLETVAKTRLSFNHLGALRFEREIRLLISGLSNVRNFYIRDVFARLTQISVLLSAETRSEVENYLSDTQHQSSWKLSESDITKVLSLRVDFS